MIDMDAARGSDSDTAAASRLRRSDILIAVDQRGRGGVDGGPAFSAGLSREGEGATRVKIQKKRPHGPRAETDEKNGVGRLLCP